MTTDQASMIIIENLNERGLCLVKQFYKEFHGLLEKYVDESEGIPLFKSDENRRLEKAHLVTLIKGQELDTFVFRDDNLFNIFRQLHNGPVIPAAEKYRELTNEEKVNLKSDFRKFALIRDPQVDLDTLKEVEKITKLADSLRQRNVHFLGLVAFQSLGQLRTPTKILNSNKAQDFFNKQNTKQSNLLHQFHNSVNQFVEGEAVTAAVKERKRQRRSAASGGDVGVAEFDSEKRRRLQLHFIRESLWSILGGLGVKKSMLKNKFPTRAFNSDSNWVDKQIVFVGWPKEAKNIKGEVVLVKGLNTSLCNFDKTSLDVVQDYISKGWIEGRRMGVRAVSCFRGALYFPDSTDVDKWGQVLYDENSEAILGE